MVQNCRYTDQVTGWTAEELWFVVRQEKFNFSPPVSRPALGAHPHPYLKVIGSTLHLDITAPGGKGGDETDHSLPSAVIKNEWRFISIPHTLTCGAKGKIYLKKTCFLAAVWFWILRRYVRCLY